MTKVHFSSATDFSELANKIFEEQKSRIVKHLPFADIQHIGSTAIPNSVTKGDLDVVVRVPSDKLSIATQVLKNLYEINQPENWTNNFASFKDENNLGIDFGVQLVLKGSKSDDFVKLRDILIDHPELVSKFNSIKMSFEGKSMNEYRKEKADFFQMLREKFL